MASAARKAQTVAPGLHRLMHQPQYVARGVGMSGQLVARHYRLIIFVFAFSILVLSLLRYYGQSSARWLLAGALAIYPLYTLFRNWLRGVMDDGFYNPRIQFVRAQVGIWAVTCLTGALAAIGIQQHELWLLFTMPLWLVSEHSSSNTAVLVWLETVGLLIAATWIGAQIDVARTAVPWDVRITALTLMVQVLWLGLLTFLTHYLMRNIHGRDRAYQRHLNWLNVITQRVVPVGEPDEQRRALLEFVADATGFEAELWLPVAGGERFVDSSGQAADAQATAAARTGRLCAVFAKPEKSRHTEAIAVLPGKPLRKGAAARIFIPVSALARDKGALNDETGPEPRARSDSLHSEEESSGLAGVIELVAREQKAAVSWLEFNGMGLQDLAHYARPVLVASHSRECQIQQERLAARLNQLTEPPDVLRQALDDILGEFGFEFALLGTIDGEGRALRFELEKNTGWEHDVVLPLLRGGLARPLVCPAAGNGDVDPTCGAEGAGDDDGTAALRALDARIFERCQEPTTRVWLPIPYPSSAAPFSPPLAVAAVGFRRGPRRCIAHEQIDLLVHYVSNVGIALTNADLHHRRNSLAAGLTALHSFSRITLPKALLADPDAVVRFVGKEAEKLFAADAVVVQLLDHRTGRLRQAYVTPRFDAPTGSAATQALQLIEPELNDLIRGGVSVYWSDFSRGIHLGAEGRWAKGAAPPQRRVLALLRSVKSLAFVPLLMQNGRALGGVFLCFAARRPFPVDEQQIMEIFGGQAGALAEAAINHQADREKAIAFERASLAAKLHDNLSQDLWALHLFAGAAGGYLRKERYEEAIGALASVQQLANVARAELGASLKELRTEPQLVTDFAAEMNTHIARMQLLFKSSVEFEAEAEHPGVSAPPAVQFYLARIAREALNNALRHARGCRIRIRYVVAADGAAHLTVEDDGPGFDTALISPAVNHGLASMEHYAELIGGHIDVNSVPGHGTWVEVHVPVAGADA